MRLNPFPGIKAFDALRTAPANGSDRAKSGAMSGSPRWTVRTLRSPTQQPLMWTRQPGVRAKSCC